MSELRTSCLNLRPKKAILSTTTTSSTSTTTTSSMSLTASTSSTSLNPLPISYSKGLMCFRKYGQAVKILVARRRYSFQFHALVLGNSYYSTADLTINFANKLTLVEKKGFIDGFDFNGAYLRCYRNKLSTKSAALCGRLMSMAKQEFDNTMTILMPHIITSYRNGIDGPLPWSIPKGRANANEKNNMGAMLACATREFYEETKIDLSGYTVHHDAGTYNYCYSDEGRNYNMEYFFSTANSKAVPFIDNNDLDQVDEVSELRWVTFDSFEKEVLDDVTKEQVLGRLPRIFELYDNYIKSKQIPPLRQIADFTSSRLSSSVSSSSVSSSSVSSSSVSSSSVSSSSVSSSSVPHVRNKRRTNRKKKKQTRQSCSSDFWSDEFDASKHLNWKKPVS